MRSHYPRGLENSYWATHSITNLMSKNSEEGQMAQGDVRSIVEMAKKIDGMVSEMTDLPEWVQAKITKAQDYLSAVAEHLSHPGEDEEAEDEDEDPDPLDDWAGIPICTKEQERILC